MSRLAIVGRAVIVHINGVLRHSDPALLQVSVKLVDLFQIIDVILNNP